ncbi:hypothetical protein SprV_0200715100 [Sparganum proliferum]
MSLSHPESEVAGPNTRHRCTGTDGNPQHLPHAETTAAELERSSRADGRRAITQMTLLWRRRHRFPSTRRLNPPIQETLKSSLKRLLINPANWEDLARDRPTWKTTFKTGAAIYEANRIAGAKAKREACKSQLNPSRNANAQPPSTCQRTFRARIGLAGHIQINCTTRNVPPTVPLSASSSSSPPQTNSDRFSEPPFSSSSSSSSPSFASTSPAVVAFTTHINTPHNSDTFSNINTATVDTRGEDQDYACSHRDRTFTSHIGLVGHLRIRRTEADEAVPGAPTYTHRNRLHCQHGPRTFTCRMGLFGHMRIHEHLR